MPDGFNIVDDLTDNVDIVYLDEDEIDNLDDEELVDTGDDVDDIDPPEDKSSVTFKGHTRSVFCGTFSSDGYLAITGGEDDLAFVWDVKTANILLECSGHKDSVTAASFSHDNKFVVTGDMSGLVQVWNVPKKNLVWCYEGDELEWLIWHHSAYVVIGGVQSGEIYMWQIPQGNCKVLPSNGFKCVCGILLKNGTHLAAGYDDGSIRIWDLKTMAVVCQHTGDGNGSVTDLKLSPDGKLLITCGQTRALVLKTVDCRIATCLEVEGSDEIETAAVCPEPELPILVTGHLNGDLCFWNLPCQALRNKVTIGNTITSVIWGLDALLFVGCVDGAVYIYNGRNGQLLGMLTGHVNAILDVQLSKDSKFLLTTSDDMTAKIFEIDSCILQT